MGMSAEVLIENSFGEILMLLRDDKPTIKWPNRGDFLGGVMDPRNRQSRPLEENSWKN